MTAEIVQMLDQLAEFDAQVTVLTLDKQKLLDEVKVPAEVQAIHDEGSKRKRAIQQNYQNQLLVLEEEKREKLAEVVVPPEIRAAYEAVAARRKAIEDDIDQKKRQAYLDSVANESKVDDEFTSQIADALAKLDRRKAEISAEFAGKIDAASENIAKLTAEIKAEVVKAGKTIKGTFYQAIYVKGRITWNTDKMEAWLEDHPFLKDARKEGAPSVTLRKG
jgi:hypothetical protein